MRSKSATSRWARALLFLALALPAAAHDFTDRNVKDLEMAIEVWIGPEQIYVDYWYLYGEIEATEARRRMDSDHDGKIDASERKAWLAERGDRLAQSFLTDLDEKQVSLAVLSEPQLDMTVDDVGSIPFKLCFELTLPTKDLPAGDHVFRFAAKNIDERPVLQKLVFTSDQCEFVGGIPQKAVAYPPGTPAFPGAPDRVVKVFSVEKKLGSAEVGTQVYLRFRKPEQYATPTDPRTGRTNPSQMDSALQWLVRALTNERITLPIAMAALFLAFLWGMGHAFTPGHGKTLVGAYLAGERGTIFHAVLLGLVVTVTHLASVVVMCVALWYALSRARGGDYRDAVNYWAGIASGAITILVGASLLLARLRGRGPSLLHDDHDPHHDHDPDHDHDHPHGHDHDHGHSHLPAGGGPPPLWSIVSLGISGGIVPCPTAWVLLLLSIQVDRLAWGLFLILAFSLGLAMTLVTIGIALVRAKRLLDAGPRGERLIRLATVASPLLIMGLGVFLTWQTIAWRAALRGS